MTRLCRRGKGELMEKPVGIPGVSTRKVKAITEELCGHAFSASAVSEISRCLDEQLEQFASRSLSSE